MGYHVAERFIINILETTIDFTQLIKHDYNKKKFGNINYNKNFNKNKKFKRNYKYHSKFKKDNFENKKSVNY